MKILIEEPVLRQALDALESCDYDDQQLKLGQYFDDGDVETAITALRSALDAAEKVEPHWPTIRMDISEGICGTCKLGAKNCDVDLDGHCGGLK